MSSESRKDRPPSIWTPATKSPVAEASPPPPAIVRIAFWAMGLTAVTLFAATLVTSVPWESAPESVAAIGDAAERAQLMDGELPLRVNDQVDRWIGRLLGEDRASFEAFLVREGLYGEMIRERLRARGMPEGLLYLAMIESGFSATAVSRGTASGVWQFMDDTALAYGLKVDEWVDERHDPIRATEAALDYLAELRATFGSWYLAAAAYNAGPTRVAAALARNGAQDGTDEELYWEISSQLPRETRDYVPKMLAATIIAQRPEHFGFDVERSLPYSFERVFIPGGTALSTVAIALGVEPTLIRELNPHLIRGMTPPGESYLVRVPLGDSHRVVASIDLTND